MSFTNFLGKIGSAVVHTALLPADAVVDVLTCGRATLCNGDEPAVIERAKKILDLIEDAADELEGE